MSEPAVRLRSTLASRIWVGGFCAFFCAGLLRNADSILGLAMIAFAVTIAYRVFRLEAAAEPDALLVRNPRSSNVTRTWSP